MSAATDLEWMARGACKDVDPEWFFPGAGSANEYANARKVCASCPVRSECFQYAMANIGLFGMWGGTSEKERSERRSFARYATPDGMAHGDKAGTVAGYYRELRAKVPPCDECREANNSAVKERKKRRKQVAQ